MSTNLSSNHSSGETSQRYQVITYIYEEVDELLFLHDDDETKILLCGNKKFKLVWSIEKQGRWKPGRL